MKVVARRWTIFVTDTLRETWLAVFHVLKQAFDVILLFDGGEFVFQRILCEDTVRGGVGGLLPQDAGAEAIERGGFLLSAGDGSGGVGFAERAGSTVLRDQHLAGGLRLL